jgi:creatinine amidohydrolase
MKELARMRIPEVADAVRAGDRVFVPLGATEQHGPHLAYCTDSLLATEACRRIASIIGGVVAPAVPYGLSGDHLGFPGVPYLSVRTFIGVIQDVARTLASGGFRSIVFVNGHYSNVMAISAAIAEVGEDLPEGAFVTGFNYWDALPPEELAAFIGAEVGLHANVGETSAVLAVDPTLVDMDEALREYPDFEIPATPAMVGAFFFSRMGTTSSVLASGVWGDPRDSTAELGETFLSQIADSGAKFVTAIEGMQAQYPRRTLQDVLRQEADRRGETA